MLNELFADFIDEEDIEPANNGSDDVPLAITQLPSDGINLKEHLAELEISLIKQSLDQSDGVVARAAELLGMRRTTLVEKMRKYDLQREE